MTENQSRGPGLFHHGPEDIELRKKCIIAAREYHAALEQANSALLETDKLLEKFEVVEKRKYHIYENLLKQVELCLANADWSVSLFFQGIGNRIKILRDQLVAGLEKHQTLILPAGTLAKEIMNSDLVCVYVSLYLADGRNLQKWIGVLNSLSRLSIGRPIYRTEQDVINVIRAKPDQSRDAYVSVYIHADDIIPPFGGNELKDRLGHELLTIRDGVISSQNIKQFVQVTERLQVRYRFEKGQLILDEHQE